MFMFLFNLFKQKEQNIFDEKKSEEAREKALLTGLLLESELKQYNENEKKCNK